MVNSVPAMLRYNGRAELTGDLLLMCMNGSGPRTVDFTVFLSNTRATSRLLNPAAAATEALLLVDEPGAQAAVPCPASQTCENANVYQGRLAGQNSLVWPNVKLNVPPGGMQVLRFTNIRVDASLLGVPSSTAPPIMTYATLAASDPALNFNPGPVVVAFSGEGIHWQLRNAANSEELTAPLAFNQCAAYNEPLARNPFSTQVPDGVSFVVRVSETGSQDLRAMTISSAPAPSAEVRPLPEAQHVPGLMYGTESGFYDPAYPAAGGMNGAGLATQATRFIVRFQVPAGGMQVHAPVYELGRNSSNSRVRLIAANRDGASPFYAALPVFSPFNGGLFYSRQVSYVYEVTARSTPSPYLLDDIDLPFVIAHPGGSSVKPGQTQVSVELAPLSGDHRPAEEIWTPRFKDSGDWRPVAVLDACTGASGRIPGRR